MFQAQQPDDMVSLQCQGKTFVVHKDILRKNSDYFKACFDHEFVETHTSSLVIDHTDPDNLGVYLFFAHRQVMTLSAPLETVFNDESDSSFEMNASLTSLLELYELCNYFQNTSLLNSLKTHIHSTVLGNWSDCLKTRKLKTTDWYFRSFADAFDYCEQNHVLKDEFQDALVEGFCSKVSSEDYTEHCDAIADHHAFIFDVAKRFKCQLEVEQQWKGTNKVEIEQLRQELQVYKNIFGENLGNNLGSGAPALFGMMSTARR